jgi:hypothetical protein
MRTVVRRSQVPEAVGALGFYCVLAIAFFARGVVHAPAHTVVGDAGPDKSIFMWSFVWWPHALAHLHDPLAANVVWAPHGIDLAWAATVPGGSLLALPFTLLAGPVVAYNVLAVAAPALAAWTAFLLARHVTSAFAPALIGGFVFGFSSYELGQTVGHLHLTLVFLVPVCALLAVLRFEQRLTRRRFVLALALALTGQFLFSTEVFGFVLFFGIVYATFALWRFGGEECALVARTVREAGTAVLVCCVVVAPYLVHALSTRDEQPLRSPNAESADVLNYVIPTRRTWIRPPGSEQIVERFTATGAERGAYLGVPIVAAVALFALRRRRRPAETALLLTLGALILSSFGSRIRVGGRIVGVGPWEVPAKLPVSDGALPVRLTMLVALCAGLVCSLWLAERGGRSAARWALVLVGVVALLPTFSQRLWTSEVPRSTFFETHRYERYLRPGETALVLPYGPAGWSLLWQAETGMRFRMVGGHLGVRTTLAEALWEPVYRALSTGALPAAGPGSVRRFLTTHGVDAIVVGPGARPKVQRLVRRVLPSVVPARSSDALVYRLSPLTSD